MMEKSLIKKKLKSDNLSPKDITRLLHPAAFIDPDAALSSIKRIYSISGLEQFFLDLLPALLNQLANVASPDRALINFEHFIDRTDNKKEFLRFLLQERHVIEMLIILFAGSQFLTDILLNDPRYLEQIKNRKKLSQPKKIEQFYQEVSSLISNEDQLEEKFNSVRKFQRWELLRIGASDLFGLLNLQTVTNQLSSLADCIIKICLDSIVRSLGLTTEGFAIIALGKLGGSELNYSSDIDLLFIGQSNNDKYQRIGQHLIKALTHVSAHGFLYRVDMRLRPWGSVGNLVPSVDDNILYFHKHARLWEKQAMLKARNVAGDEQIGHRFLRKIKSLIFDLPKEELRKEVLEMKKKIETGLKRKGHEWGEVKGGQGSIRDIEFVTQYLQLVHGKKYPEVRSINTLNALARLNTAGVLTAKDYRIMVDGYLFLRSVEHYLQIMYNQQTHILPKDSRELNYLAKRLAFEGDDVGKQFVKRYEQQRLAIRKIYQYYLDNIPKDSIKEVNYQTDELQHIARMGRSYNLTFSKQEIKHHSRLARALNNDNLVEVIAEAKGKGEWRVTIVAYDYLGILSIICGLLFEYGFNIIDGHIFTYEPEKQENKDRGSTLKRRFRKSQETGDSRRKLVDVFSVKSVKQTVIKDLWQNYKKDLSWFLQCLKKKQYQLVQGEIANRVARMIKEYTGSSETLLSIDIEIDNIASEDYTVLRIDAPDTIGFLFEFTNALALNNIYIARVIVHSLSDHIHDTLFVTDPQGNKISDPEKQNQLRAAAVLVKQFTHLLPRSPNPHSAMMHFRELISNLFLKTDWQKELASLERPEVLAALARLLGVSDFLWDDFLRMQHENLFPVLMNVESLKYSRSKKQLKNDLNGLLYKCESKNDKKNIDIINRFKDREMFRIDMRYILGMFTDFWQFFTDLSDLAEIIVESVYNIVYKELIDIYGQPRLKNNKLCKLSICALGKLGGREIGLASDIELLFLYQGQGQTDGGQQISNSEFYNKLVNKFVKYIKAKREGIFKIDLRLRPYGKAGSMAVPLDSFKKYYAAGGAAWEYEKQALVKLRPVAGDQQFGEEIVKLRDNIIYTNKSIDLAAMYAIRERQKRQLVAGGTINAKFSSGGLVDLEYLIQELQIIHGKENVRLRIPNTREALIVLKELTIISVREFNKLHSALMFLRKLIMALRVVRGNANDLTIPEVGTQEFTFLSNRLDYESPDMLQKDIMRNTTNVYEINQRLLLQK